MEICCNVCNKYRKLKNPNISYIFKKELRFSIVYSKCGHEYEKIFKGEEYNIEEYHKIYNLI